jgi:hypothetical protein
MPLSRLQLARAVEVSGDTAGARRAYEQFLTSWKDADPDLPVYQQGLGPRQRGEGGPLIRGGGR